MLHSPQAKKASGSCPFLRAKTKAKDNFKEAILAQPVDVEELGQLGRRKMVCPYYTARSAVPEAQLVLLPYSALLAQVSWFHSLIFGGARIQVFLPALLIHAVQTHSFGFQSYVSISRHMRDNRSFCHT